jgi:hypothetical protein
MKEDMDDNEKPQMKTFGKKQVLSIVVAVVVVVAVAAGLLLYVGLHKNTKHVQETPNPGYNQTEDELADHKQQVQVILTADGPQPQTLRVPVDTLIGWRNQDSKAHELAISPGTKVPDKFYNFRTLEPSGGYLFVIHQKGTFHYYDVAAPTHTGVIIVGDK